MKKSPGFTLIEFVIAIGLFGFMTSILVSTLMNTHHIKSQLEDKKILHQELISVLNNSISGLIRSGFAIDYDRTLSNVSDGGGVGIQENVDQLSIFIDQAETNHVTFYRKPYVEKGEFTEGGQLYVKFNEGEEFPLHSSEVIIEDFDVMVPSDPRFGGDRDIQPYVNIYLRGVKNTDLINAEDEPKKASYSTMLTLRNAGLASYKNKKISH